MLTGGRPAGDDIIFDFLQFTNSNLLTLFIFKIIFFLENITHYNV